MVVITINSDDNSRAQMVVCLSINSQLFSALITTMYEYNSYDGSCSLDVMLCCTSTCCCWYYCSV